MPNDNFNSLPYLVVLLVEDPLLTRQKLRRLTLPVRRLYVCCYDVLGRLVCPVAEHFFCLGQRSLVLDDGAHLAVVGVAAEQKFAAQNLSYRITRMLIAAVVHTFERGN